MEEIYLEDRYRQSMPTAFKVSVRILTSWGFEVDEMADPLGLSSEVAKHYRQNGLPESAVTEKLTTRVSYILGIEKALEILFAGAKDQAPDRIRGWMAHPSAVLTFGESHPKTAFVPATWKLWQPPSGILTGSSTANLKFQTANGS